jgi:hypothetical protein
MQIQYFQQAPVSIEEDLLGFSTLKLANIPAFREEPLMVPADALRRWALIYYTDQPGVAPEKYWRKYAGEMYREQKRKVAQQVEDLARAAVADASTPEEKTRRLIDVCRRKIKRVDDDASGLTSHEKKKLRKDRRSEDVLAAGQGTGEDVIRLFLALAAAAGLDARYAAVPDGSRSIFDPRFPDDYFLVGRSIAVRVADGWRFCDPAAMYLPAGWLRWQEEGQPAVIADPDGAPIVMTPVATPEKSRARREARLRLAADGTVEGDVREEYTGHLAARLKEANDERSVQEREDALKSSLKERLSTAEPTGVAIENLTDGERPLIRSYHVRVPGYAQRTGRRIFLRPSFFEAGAKAVFSTSMREHPVGFDHAWSEEDRVTIELPPGCELDSADVPAAADSAPVAEYKVAARVVNGHTLDFQRTFYFGGGGHVVFPVKLYATLKAFFDHVRASDDHALTLKAASPAAAP